MQCKSAVNKHRTPMCLLIAACLLCGCVTEQNRVRAGIQDPVVRHKRNFWDFAAEVPAKKLMPCDQRPIFTCAL